jgi:hypothetical protein
VTTAQRRVDHVDYTDACATLQVTRGTLLAARLIIATVAAFILPASFFLLPPGLDIAVEDIFYIPGLGFCAALAMGSLAGLILMEQGALS